MMRILFAVLFFASSAFATQRHATPGGAGAHTGMDLSNAWSHAEAMYAEAGDTVNLHAGTYPYIYSLENDGTASQPIVVRAYGTDVVTFTGPSDGDVAVVYMYGSYTELYGVRVVTAENPAWDSDYMVSVSGNHNVFRRNRVTYAGNPLADYLDAGLRYRTRGIALSGQYNTIDSSFIRGFNENLVLAGGSPRYHTIRADTIYAAVWNNIICGGTNDGSSNWMGVLIEGCRIDTSHGEDGIQSQPGTDPYSYEKNKGYIIRNNYIANCYENGIDLKGCSYVVIEGNTIHTFNSDDDGAANGAEDWGTGPAIERGNPGEINDWYTVVRNNVIYDGPGGITMSHGGQLLNNVFANNRRKLTTSNTADSTETGLRDVNIEGSSTQRSILNNIMVGQPNYSYLYFYNMDNGTDPFTLDHNIYYDSASVARFYHRKGSGSTAKVYTLANWKTALSSSDYSYVIGKEAHSLEANPTFVNGRFRPIGYSALWDWTLDAGSPGINAGRAWTFANGSGTGSSALVVDNPYVFTDGFGIAQGDSIYFHGAARRILYINYSTSTLTLSAAHTWSDNDSVWFCVNALPVKSIGLFAPTASGGGIIDPGGPPSTPTNLAPANGSSRTSPVTFSWSKPSGAVNYQLCVTPDNWGSLIVNQPALTDTFYTVALPQGGSFKWNVAASNTYGQSTFSGDWTFTTSVSSTYRDTLTLNWNSVKHERTLDTNTVIQFSHLQRVGITVVISNPNGKELSWSGVTWQTAPPPLIPGALSMYEFYWKGADSVLGKYISNTGSSSVTWSSVVGNIEDNAALKARLDSIEARLAVLEGSITPPETTSVVGDSVTTAWTNGASLTYSHRCFGNNRLLVVSVSATFSSVSGVTYNGDALTLAESREFSGFGSFVYYLVAPDTGTHDVVVTLGGAVDVIATACGYTGINQSTPVQNAADAEGTSTGPGVTVSSSTGDFILDCLCWNIDGALSATAGAGQTQCGQATQGDYCGHAVSVKAGAASVTTGWTLGASKEWAIVGISINRL